MANERKGWLWAPALSALILLAACAKEPERKVAAPSPEPTATAGAAGRKVLYWYDPMVPGSKFDKPGKSPFMDMELLPKYADEASPEGASQSAAAATLSPQEIRETGVATVPVERGEIVRNIRAVGTIDPDEAKLVRVAARVNGRVEKLYADFTGQYVRAGAPLYQLYSPELVATEREYLLALENRRGLREGTAEAVRSADDLVAAARERLRLWGIGAAQIAALEKTGKLELALTYRSPISGTVLQKSVVEGQYVTEGTEMYLLADLSRVWLVARVYEYELGSLREGQKARITIPALPGRTIEGTVSFIDPVLDRDTRSARVRVVLANPRGDLKPGMFGNADLRIPARPSLVIPRSALIDTGVRRVVYVEVAPNRFAARDVRVGEASGDLVAVLEGLREGERVVAAANFFVDSQAQLAAGSAIQYGGALDVRTTPTPGSHP